MLRIFLRQPISLVILAMVREESLGGGGVAGGGSGGDADAAERYESCHNGSVPVGLNSSSGAQGRPLSISYMIWLIPQFITKILKALTVSDSRAQGGLNALIGSPVKLII
jgi:hypothetical protein